MYNNGMNGSLKAVVLERLKKSGVEPDTRLGQHFLIDKEVISLLASEAKPGNLVIEVGSGIGQLTAELAKKSSKLISIEVDERYSPILDNLAKKYKNLRLVYGNALKFNFNNLRGPIQIIASLPYHISEPFLRKLIFLPFKSAILVVGDKLGKSIGVDETNPYFGQLTLLTRAFFDVEEIAKVKREKFYPTPRTDSVIIRLTLKRDKDINNVLFRRLFLTSNNSPLVKNSLMEGLIELEPDGLTKNEAREIIERLKIDQKVLNKPFDQLNNEDLRNLSNALKLIER